MILNFYVKHDIRTNDKSIRLQYGGVEPPLVFADRVANTWPKFIETAIITALFCALCEKYNELTLD